MLPRKGGVRAACKPPVPPCRKRPPVRATAYLAHPIYFVPLTVTAANPAAAIVAFNAGRSLASSASKRAV